LHDLQWMLTVELEAGFVPLLFLVCHPRVWYGAGAVFFWAPMMKWGLVAAGASEMNRPVEKVSVPQSLGTLRWPVVQRWACGQQWHLVSERWGLRAVVCEEDAAPHYSSVWPVQSCCCWPPTSLKS